MGAARRRRRGQEKSVGVDPDILLPRKERAKKRSVYDDDVKVTEK